MVLEASRMKNVLVRSGIAPSHPKTWRDNSSSLLLICLIIPIAALRHYIRFEDAEFPVCYSSLHSTTVTFTKKC